MRAAAVDNPRAKTVIISGASGPNAGFIDGRYSPTQEKGLDGRILYIKCDDDHVCASNAYLTQHFSLRCTSTCLEHISGFWTIKTAALRGQDGNYAFVEGDRALDLCGGSRVWKQYDGGGSWVDEPGIRMKVVIEAADIRHSDTPNLCLSDVIGPDGKRLLMTCRNVEAGCELTLDHVTLSTLPDGVDAEFLFRC